MKKQKGITLVEVLVATSILITFVGTILFSTIMTAKKTNERHILMCFINECYAINEYCNEYGKDWDIYYFNDQYINHDVNHNYVYYDETFKPSLDSNAYRLCYSYNEENNLFIDVLTRSNKYIIENLDYGKNRF